MAEPEQKRRRLGAATVETIESFTGEPATETLEPRSTSLDDDLDPGGRPYRQGHGDRSDDPRLPGGWGRIVRTVFRIDEEAAFAQLQKVTLDKKPSRMSYGERVDAMDEASEKVTLAAQLAENAKVVLALYEIDVELIRAPMYADARAKIAEDRKKNDGGKVISADDVKHKVAELWPDEHRRQEENLAKARGAVTFCQKLSERWQYRMRELDGLVRSSPHS